jgi:predicted Zn-dependent protease
LLTYLDTFYTDPAGWSLLAELYADQGLYAQSLTALGHVMVIQSWDSGAVCRAGETAYTLG